MIYSKTTFWGLYKPQLQKFVLCIAAIVNYVGVRILFECHGSMDTNMGNYIVWPALYLSTIQWQNQHLHYLVTEKGHSILGGLGSTQIETL